MKFMVAFSSPKRASKTLEVAARHAQALQAELVLARVVPDAKKIGIIAELIATEQPLEKAQQQIDLVVAELISRGLKASGLVRVGEAAPTLTQIAGELGADLIFLGTTGLPKRPSFLSGGDPVVRYLIDHCPVSLVLVRHENTPHSAAASPEAS
jgi:nucleotide-binding universal stress UspA family protein